MAALDGLDPESAGSNRHRSVRQVAAASIGNVFESYDFLVYAFVADHIAVAFFGEQGSARGLMAAFAVFGVGLIARPFGAWFLGRLSDRHGRRVALIASLLGMAIGTVGIGLLPDYSSIGRAAPILLIALRCMQGFCAGGEWGTATAFVVESAPASRRGTFGSIGQAANYAAMLLAGAIVATLTSRLSPSEMGQWGWRLAFLFGALLIPVALWLRSRLEETQAFHDVRQDDPSRHALPLAATARTFGLTIVFTVSSYLLLGYFPTFASHYGGLSAGEALTSNSIAVVFAVLCTIGAGRLSDRFGRRAVLLAGCGGLVVASYPLFLLAVDAESIGRIIAIQLAFNLLVGTVSGPMAATLVELFPANLRTTYLSLGYTFCTVLLGGFSPLIVTALITYTGAPTAPALFLIAAAAASGWVAFTMRETAWAPLR
ncbi:MFS transporter [Novosphingobium piscinae]|uniref:MFS transporter n=1 Tax=Novosphingobium piscinae TaxID=1507448 RepID=A0A7X1FYD4_9SPHN|nr:MFS transporter [Novosphingobium piscinae]MBC2669291.1 MFS transporter [Novosphingobium piscinae]